MAVRAKERGYKRILLDRRNLAEAPKTEFARFAAGVAVADLLPPPFRLAAVYPHKRINRFGEDVAANRGATVAIFSDIEKAKVWLTSS